MSGQPLRIGLVGCAGLGKGTVAKAVAERLGVPCLLSKTITRPILSKYGWNRKSDSEVEAFLSHPSVEQELLESRIRREDALSVSGFVADRTVLECFAYTLLEHRRYPAWLLESLEQTCRERISIYDRLFYFPLAGGWYEDNGVRTTNAASQRVVDIAIRGLLEDWKVPAVRLPEAESADRRIEHIAALISGENTV